MLRHGQSEWNALRRWQGRADTPLTALGREQARAAATALGHVEPPVGSIWSSNLARASETASIIASQLALPAPVIEARFAEADAGEWQGLTPAEIEQDWPGWRAARRRPAGFEPADEMAARVFQGLDAVVSQTAPTRSAECVVVVCHSGVIHTVLRRLGNDQATMPNLGGVWLSIDRWVRSSIDGPLDRSGMHYRGRFDPGGIPASGIDTGREHPGQ